MRLGFVIRGRVVSGGGLANLERRVPFESGNEAAVRHGAQATLMLQPRAAEIANGLRTSVSDFRSCDEPTLMLLALTLARIERAHAWLEAQPELVTGKAGKPWPLLDLLPRWEAQALKLLGALGMTPQSRSRAAAEVSGAAALASYLERASEGGAS